MLVHKTAAALLIGNELLSGKIQEANLIELARTLRSIGIDLRFATMVPDDEADIIREVQRLSKAFDVVFTSGGIGPTHDDITLEAVGKAFGAVAQVDPRLDAILKTAYGENYTTAHQRMALVPQGATQQRSADSRWPTIVVENVWCLPGVPEIFKSRLELVKEQMRGPKQFFSRAVYTDMDEGHVAPLLDQIVERYPQVSVGSYPTLTGTDHCTKLTFDGGDEAETEAATQAFLSLLPQGEPKRVE